MDRPAPTAPHLTMQTIVPIVSITTDAEERQRLLAGTQRALVCGLPMEKLPRPLWVALLPLDTADPRGDANLIARVSDAQKHMGPGGWQWLTSFDLVGFGPALTFRLPRPVASLKNTRALGWIERNGKARPTTRKSKLQVDDIDMVKRYASVAIGRSGWKPRGPQGRPFDDEDLIRLEVVHVCASDELEVTAIRIGALAENQPKHTKRDVHGMVELVADALTGTWWHDDSRIDMATQRRAR